MTMGEIQIFFLSTGTPLVHQYFIDVSYMPVAQAEKNIKTLNALEFGVTSRKKKLCSKLDCIVSQTSI